MVGPEQNGNIALNRRNTTSVAKHFPDCQGCGSVGLLCTSSKPLLAPLARLSSTEEMVPERRQALKNANIPVLAKAATTPASGSLVISSLARGWHEDLSMPTALPPLLPSNFIQDAPRSRSTDAVETKQSDGVKSLEQTMDSRSANSLPVCPFAWRIPQSIISPTKANVEHRCSNERDRVSVGKRGENTPNSMEMLGTGKRLGRVSSTPDPPSLLTIEVIGKALQGAQALSRNNVEEAVAETSSTERGRTEFT